MMNAGKGAAGMVVTLSRLQARRSHMESSATPAVLHDVFISHRGPDTRKNISGLLHDLLMKRGHCPFIDYRNLKPGDNLSEKIDAVIRDCKVGVIVFSPRYCESSYCLHELALLMECKKRVVPIFYNINPSKLRVGNISNGSCVSDQKEVERFRRALERAKNIVGLDFYPSRGYWSEFLQSASDAIIEQMVESS